jgi:tryptophan halogenase
MGFHTAPEQCGLRHQETSMIKRLRNETLHSTEKLLSVLPSNREFLSGLKKV